MTQPSAVPNPWRLLWLLAVASHALAAAGWWALMPGGFPVGHPRFWINGILPPVALGAIGLMIADARKGRTPRLLAGMAAFPGFWAAAGVASRSAFPSTFERLWIIPAGLGLVLLLIWLATARTLNGIRNLAAGLVFTATAILGAILPFGLRPDAPTTRPLDVAWPETRPVGNDARPTFGRIGPATNVQPGDGSITVRAGSVTVSAQPLLKFLSVSPDGAPVVLTPRDHREPPEPRLTGSTWTGDTLVHSYKATADLRLAITPGEAGAAFESLARLSRPIASHLNTFCDLQIRGHRSLSLAFSPCPDAAIEVSFSEYPRGRPLRFACLGADGVFRVLEASSGEKGPFRELAKGPLGRGEPLTITVLDAGTPVAAVRLDDWSSQAGTSPLAHRRLGRARERHRVLPRRRGPHRVGLGLHHAGQHVGRPGLGLRLARGRRLSQSGPDRRPRPGSPACPGAGRAVA